MVASTTPLAAAPAWLKFTHPELGFSVSYPGDWMLAGGVVGVDFVALGPEVAGVQGMRLNVNITHDGVPAGNDLRTVYNKKQEELESTIHVHHPVRNACTNTRVLPVGFRRCYPTRE